MAESKVQKGSGDGSEVRTASVDAPLHPPRGIDASPDPDPAERPAPSKSGGNSKQ